MKQRYENDVTMFATVRDFMNANTAKTSGVPAIADAVTALTGIITTLNARRASQTVPLEGIADDKDAVRTTLEEATFAVSDPLAALAASLGDNTLLAEVAKERSSLDVLSADALNDFASVVSDRATTHVAALNTDYGVTAPMLTAITTAQTAFAPWVTKPRQAIAARKGITESIPALVRSGKELLRQQLDRLMSRYRLSDPVFYGGYRGARVIVNRHGGGDSGGTPPPGQATVTSVDQESGANWVAHYTVASGTPTGWKVESLAPGASDWIVLAENHPGDSFDLGTLTGGTWQVRVTALGEGGPGQVSDPFPFPV